MKTKMSLAFLFLTFSAMAQAPQWTFEKSHCRIGFSVAHFGISETEGQFRKFQGTIATVGDSFENAAFTMNIEVNSIDTDDEQRDQHLKSADFFDAAKFPTIRFVSKSFKSSGKNRYILKGDLTMHGVTRPVVLQAEYKGTINKDPFGNTKAGFRFTGKIDRKDWGLTWNKVMDNGGIAVGDEIAFNINVELLKMK